MVSNWWGHEIGNSFNGPVWSVSVEILVYIIFFLILKLNKSIIINIIIIILCILAIKLKIPSQVFNCLAFFYIGGLSAIAYEKLQGSKYTRQIFKTICLILILIPIIIYITKIYEHKYFVTLFLLLYTPILLLFSAQQFSVSLYIQKTIEAAGNMTYSIYLIHFPLQLTIAICLDYIGREIPYYSKELFWGYILTTLLISFYIYKFFELPVRNKIRIKWL
jgi:peptidoglycan/LPS O-acetylase OafA/YrhL